MEQLMSQIPLSTWYCLCVVNYVHSLGTNRLHVNKVGLGTSVAWIICIIAIHMKWMDLYRGVSSIPISHGISIPFYTEWCKVNTRWYRLWSINTHRHINPSSQHTWIVKARKLDRFTHPYLFCDWLTVRWVAWSYWEFCLNPSQSDMRDVNCRYHDFHRLGFCSGEIGWLWQFWARCRY